MVERDGFEPSKAEPTDLQSVPFNHSGTSPIKCLLRIPLFFNPYEKTKNSVNAQSGILNKHHNVAVLAGLEPATHGLTVRCSNRLN